MLLLICPNNDGSSYRLTEDKQHIVSRTNGDILLTGDQSVSRKHAVIKVTSSCERGGSWQVTVTDLGSRYGTYVNESEKLEANKPFVLKDGDIVKFGCQWNEWRLESKPLVVTTSTLPSDVKISLKNLISELGGTLVSEWQENCSHLTMTSILLTAKVVCALASAVPIVTPEYWTSFKDAVEQKKLPPDPVQFVPPLKEMILNKNKVSFAVNKERKKIFNGKTFVFPTEKQMKKYKALISAAGGFSISYGECNWEGEEFCDPDIIVMQNLSDDTQYMQAVGQFNDLLRLLKAKGRRPIPESELGLAILMCSMDIYCNPQYKISDVLLKGSEVSLSQLKTQEVLVADTPSMVGDVSVKLEKTPEETPLKRHSFLSDEPSVHDLESSCRIFEMETIPYLDENKSLQLKTEDGDANVEADKGSGMAPSRKRTAENESESLPSKKPLLEKDPLEELFSESQCGAFQFVDICANMPSRKTRGREALLESNKRKYVESDEVTHNEQPKKSRLEDDIGTKQVNSSSNKILENNCSSQGKLSITSEAGSSKTFKRNFSDEINTLDRETNKNAMDSKSRESGDSVNLDDSDDPTSKEQSGDDPIIKMKKKKWNRGMAAVIFDMVVKFDDLIVERPSPAASPCVSQSKVNFKKFKKVRPLTFKNSLPEIIGDGDLYCA